ncbi:MAG: hypothetical protein K2N98_11025 [Lachnospiraceae bacterium]|nr:hypothetical protein [Lachnospiraceae bacterium]
MKKKIWPMGIWMATVIGLSGCGITMNRTEDNSVSPQREEAATESEDEEDVQDELTEPEHEGDIFKDTAENGQPEKNEPSENWQTAYQVFLDDWKQIEKYGDFGYLEWYFGDNYSFDKYFLCDIDKNGIPELLLYSTCMRLTAVFTYADEPVFLVYNRIYGINPETNEVVTNGHWHGAGGSGIDEWSAYTISGDVAEYSLYIDFIDTAEYGSGIRYSIYDGETEEYKHIQDDSTEYDALYAAHVEPCIPAEEYHLYDLSDAGGFAHIQ